MLLFWTRLRCLADTSVKVEDVMPIATGHEREELEVELQVSFPLPLSLLGFKI